MASSAYIRRDSRGIHEFGPFRLNEGERLLSRDGEPVALTPKVFDTLLLLVQNSGHLVDKEELMKAVWPDSFVEEANLNRCISTLRRALGETPNDPRYIETVPKRGYRFIAKVDAANAPETAVRSVPDSRPDPMEASLRRVHSGGEVVSENRAEPIKTRIVTRPVAAIAGVILLLIGTLLYYGLSHRSAASGAAMVKPAVFTSLAVLPFRALSGPTKDDDPGLGITDVLITRLSNVREIIVRPTSAVLKYKEENQDPVEAGRALKVDAVLEGSVQRVDDRIRVTVRLMDVKKGSQLFGGSFTEPAADMLRVQDSIAERVAKALSVELNPEATGYTRNARASDLYARGRVLFNRRDYESLKKAEIAFRQAIEEDSSFALAYVGVADSLAIQGLSIECRRLQEQALRLEPNLAEAYASMGFHQIFYEWDWEQAEQNLKRAIELKPGYVSSYLWYGNLLAITGRLEEAKGVLHSGLQIDPSSHNLLADLGQVHYFSREYDKAKEFCDKALEQEPNFLFARDYLSDIYRKLGDWESSIEAGRKSGAGKEVIKEYGGRTGYIEHQLSTFKRIYDYDTSYPIAKWSAAAGDKQQALEYLEKAYGNRAFLVAFVGADPVFDDLRSEPRYKDLLRKMALTRWLSQ